MLLTTLLSLLSVSYQKNTQIFLHTFFIGFRGNLKTELPQHVISSVRTTLQTSKTLTTRATQQAVSDVLRNLDVSVSSWTAINRCNEEDDKILMDIALKHKCVLCWEAEITNYRMSTCNSCNRRWFNLVEKQTGMCASCSDLSKPVRKFSITNNMDPGTQPMVLGDLTMVEEMLISLVHPVIQLYKLKGNQYGYRGHVISFPQDITEVITSLPRSLEFFSDIVIVGRKLKEKIVQFDIRVDRLRSAISWLQANNPHYKLTFGFAR